MSGQSSHSSTVQQTIGASGTHAAPAAPAALSPPIDSSASAAGAMRAALVGIVDKPSLYLVRAAQATTLRQLKASRKALRDYNAAARVQLEAQGPALEAAAGLLAGMRADLDAVNGALRARKEALMQQHPHVRERLLARQLDD